jgi:outer membrane protein TolC
MRTFPAAAFAAILSLVVAPPADAQTTRLTLADALRLAGDHSEAVTIALAGESRAAADVMRASSQRLPQVSLIGAYDRTLASEFSALTSSSTTTPCPALAVDPSKPIADRVAELERAAGCGAIGPGFNFSSLPFGQRNIYRMTGSFAQSVYSGGRIAAQERQAALGLRSAELQTVSARAITALDVTRAFYDAALGDRLVTIAESGYAQAAAAYEQTRQAFEAGRQPEVELLRAQVARDNQRPAVIRAKASRDVAYLRLRQLLELPPAADLAVDVELDAPALAPPAPFLESLARVEAATAALERASILQAEALVQVREAAVTIAKSERLPSVNLGSSYGKVGYPSSGAFPGTDDFRTNWTLGASVQVPIFTGRRLKADELAARADLDDAQARLKQTRELAELDVATARQDLTAADAAWQASAGTVQQAQRAYEIAELRYREGLSTQLELSDSRLSLQVAQANRAQAARDLQIARARLALLPDLPVGR